VERVKVFPEQMQTKVMMCSRTCLCSAQRGTEENCRLRQIVNL